jgi:hypothetical protein
MADRLNRRRGLMIPSWARVRIVWRDGLTGRGAGVGVVGEGDGVEPGVCEEEVEVSAEDAAEGGLRPAVTRGDPVVAAGRPAWAAGQSAVGRFSVVAETGRGIGVE